jgi:hypothetical protein
MSDHNVPVSPRRLLLPGTRVYVGDDQEHATITHCRPIGDAATTRPAGTGSYGYDVHLDTGTDLTGLPASAVTRTSDGDAKKRLAPFVEGYLTAVDAVRAVSTAEFVASYDAEHPGEMGVPRGGAPTVRDDLDALSLAAAARSEIDNDERRLIEGARAKGANWEQVGLALGSPVRSAKQRGRGRWKALGGTTTEPAEKEAS